LAISLSYITSLHSLAAGVSTVPMGVRRTHRDGGAPLAHVLHSRGPTTLNSSLGMTRKLALSAQMELSASRLLLQPTRQLPPLRRRPRNTRPPYCDEKVANRDIRIWHYVTENGY
jgi:hypothetical protein